MDKAEEIFAEGIEDRNVKTIRQARVLFVICLMAGMFIIFESDDIFKWVAVLAVCFFTDSFYKKHHAKQKADQQYKKKFKYV
jgi:hypothetical protein